MTNESSAHDALPPNLPSATTTAEECLEQAVGLPPPVTKAVSYVVKRLMTSLMDVPAAYLEGISAEARATSQARVRAINASGAHIANQIDVSPAYLQAANEKFARRIVGKQRNIDAITYKAIAELPSLLNQEPSVPAGPEQRMDEEWLDTFESEAESMSSEYMRTVFARLLAGQIAKPGKFSRRAIKLLGQMGQSEAEMFANFGSLALQFTSRGEVHNGILLSMGGRPGTNALAKYGLDYRSFLTLVEYGLLVSDLNGGQLVEFDQHGDSANIIYCGKRYRLIYEGEGPRKVQLNGPLTSRAGAELIQLVTPIQHSEYTNKLHSHLATLALRLEEY